MENSRWASRTLQLSIGTVTLLASGEPITYYHFEYLGSKAEKKHHTHLLRPQHSALPPPSFSRGRCNGSRAWARLDTHIQRCHAPVCSCSHLSSPNFRLRTGIGIGLIGLGMTLRVTQAVRDSRACQALSPAAGSNNVRSNQLPLCVVQRTFRGVSLLIIVSPLIHTIFIQRRHRDDDTIAIRQWPC
jgi:hypothetical protein